MKHFILTRFNVRMPGWSSDVRLDCDWLKGRFDLFEKLCLPSIVSQTKHDFDWYIYFDSNTDEVFKLKIKELQKTYPFHAIFVDVFDIEEIKKSLIEVSKDKRFLLTTRLDSDDLLSKYFVEELHKVVLGSGSRTRVINFDNGAILMNKNNSNFLYDYQDNSNPFSSLLEPCSENIKTIISLNHTTLHQHFEVVNIKGRAMWLQVVHGGNVSNIVRGKRVPIHVFNHEFNYLEDISKSVNESMFSLFMDQHLFGLVRHIRDQIRAFLKTFYKRYCAYKTIFLQKRE